MLNFTDNMKRIIVLAEHTLRHADACKFDSAQDDLLEISHTSSKAMKQIADMLLLKSQGARPAGGDHGPCRRQRLISTGEVPDENGG